MSEISTGHGLGPLNPYQPPISGEPSAERARLKILLIEPIAFPAGPTKCSYFSYEEFARTLTADLIESTAPFGLETQLSRQAEQKSSAVDATLRCQVHAIREYHITNWQRLIKWFLPFLGYYYYPASFIISGSIETPRRSSVPFQVMRKFNPGGLGEKANMRNGIRAEAIRLIGLAARTVDDSSSLKAQSFFWHYLLFVPLVAGAVTALIAYVTLTMVLWRMAGVAPDTKVGHIFLATFLAILVPQLTVVFAPAWLYADRRAAFAYRLISSSNSLTLRVFLMICALIASFLIALALVILVSNFK